MSTAAGTSTTDPGLDRRTTWWLVGGAAALLAAAAALLVPWDWVPGGRLTPVAADSAFTAAQIARAEDYAQGARLLSWSSYAVSSVLALGLGLTRGGSVLSAPVVRRLRWWSAVPVLVAALLLAGRVVTLPFALLLRRRRLDAGLTEQSAVGWLADQGLSLLVSAVLMSLLVLLVVGTARRWPRRWPLVAGAAAVGVTFTASLLYPVVVEPLFNRFTPMPDGAFKSSVLALAEAEGVDVDEVLVSDASRRTTTLNAYVSGLGGTRRIVVYDNLLADVPPRQARSVIAHEIAHARHHDVVLGTALGAAGALLGVGVLALLLDSQRLRRRAGVRGPGDPAVTALVLALVAVGGFVSSPVQNAVSRAVEIRADRTALDATQDPAAFLQLQRQLALRSLADPTPPRWSQLWFGSHPTALQRLGLPGSLERAAR